MMGSKNELPRRDCTTLHPGMVRVEAPAVGKGLRRVVWPHTMSPRARATVWAIDRDDDRISHDPKLGRATAANRLDQELAAVCEPLNDIDAPRVSHLLRSFAS